ncbi:MAG TPA: HEPN domain-containing protein [Prolixibacteraceae bacterium]|nr:HEPN domain-containing protein [Prolixibacteraceae bacterium]HPS11774.1 HEPN domain-containing protein [Prolixibacteraceae bacterium]
MVDISGNINAGKVAGFWIETSDNDYQTMENLFKSKDFHWSLFMGHLVLEKLLKASVVKETKKNAPFTHDLTKLAKIAGFNFSEEQLDMLDTITTFNLNARYDSYKKAFYKKCTFEFTNQWINHIRDLRSWIKQQHTK